MPTNDEIDLANWNTVDFTISGQDVLEALYDDGAYGGNAAPSNLVGLLWIDMEAWGQSCDSLDDGCNSADYASYSDGKAIGAAWDDGGNDFDDSNKNYFIACFTIPNFCEGILFDSVGDRYLFVSVYAPGDDYALDSASWPYLRKPTSAGGLVGLNTVSNYSES